MSSFFSFGSNHIDDNKNNDRNSTLQEQVEALTAVNAKLQTELFELKIFVQNLAEAILPSLGPNEASVVRDALNNKRFRVYHW